MLSGLLSVLCLCLTVPMATGLRCYSCGAFEFDTGSSAVKSALAMSGLPEDAACVNGDESVNSITCVPESGYNQTCVTIRATVSGSIYLGDFTGIETFRGCELVDSSDAEKNCTVSTGVIINSFIRKNGRLRKCYCSFDNCNNETIPAPAVGHTTLDPANSSTDDPNGQTTLVPALIPCLASLFLAVFAVL